MDDHEETRGEKPLTYRDLGIPTTPKLVEGALGKKRPLKDLEKKEIAFAAIALISSLAAIGLAIQRLVITSNGNPDFTFALIIIINALFCMYYVIYGLLAERPYEVTVMVLATFAVLMYIILNYAMSIRNDVKLARLITACVVSPVVIGLGSVIARRYYRSGRLIFRTVGADSTMQKLCKNLFMFLGLQTFDLQLNITMVLLILRSGSNVDMKDIVILSVGVPVTIACFTLGYFSVRLENKRVGYLYLTSLLLAPTYIIFKVYQSADHLVPRNGQNSTTTTWGTPQQSNALSGTTFTCAGLAFIIRVLMAIYFVKTFRNFGKGLKRKVLGGREKLNTRSHPTYSSVEDIN